MKLYNHSIDTEFFFGTVGIEIPTYSERLKLVNSLNTTVVDGKIVVEESGFAKLFRSLDELPKYVKSVDIQVKETGEKIENLDDFSAYQESGPIFNDLCVLITRGIQLGKNSQP